MVANKGAPGPNRQTVTYVKSNWEQIQPKLILMLLNGEGFNFVVDIDLKDFFNREQGLVSLGKLWKSSGIGMTAFAPEQMELCLN